MLRVHGCIKQRDFDLLGLFADAKAAAEIDDAEMADALCAAAEDDAIDQDHLPEPGHEPGAGSPPGMSNQQAAATPLVLDLFEPECSFIDCSVLG